MPRVQINIGGDKELIAKFSRLSKRLTKKWNRGAVAMAANAIRDKARQNANAVGLSTRGMHRTPSGRMIMRFGRIPDNISASVERNQGPTGIAKVFVKPAGLTFGGKGVDRRGGTEHWHMVEFGSIHNSPTPFFFRAATEAADAARAAAVEVWERNIAEANKGNI